MSQTFAGLPHFVFGDSTLYVFLGEYPGYYFLDMVDAVTFFFPPSDLQLSTLAACGALSHTPPPPSPTDDLKPPSSCRLRGVAVG